MSLCPLRCSTGLLIAAAFSLSASSQVVISDNFESDSSANYTIVNDGTPNGTQAFAFDYVAAGIPLAPNSSVGDVGGLRLTANDSAGAVDAWTLFHNTGITAPQYSLSVDVWMNFAALSGSTEYAHVGVGGDSATFNSLFSPVSGSGSFVAFTGDGGSASDYRWFLDPANGGPTTLPNTDPSYLGGGSNNTLPFYQALFPSTTVPGSPGNTWTTITIDVDELAGTIDYSFDGTQVFAGTFTGSLDGAVSLGIADVFTSVSGNSNVFTLYDNLSVEIVPEPATAALLGLGGLAMLRRRSA